MAKKGNYIYDWPRPMVSVDAAVFTFCEDKAKLLLDYEPRIATPDGLRQTARFYRDEGWI